MRGRQPAATGDFVLVGLGDGDFVLDGLGDGDFDPEAEPDGDADGEGLSFGSVPQMTVGEGR